MRVVHAEEVRVRYSETTAVDGVSITVESGEVVGLVGPNGAGKTTLVRAVTGTLDAEGTVELFGRPPRAVDRSRIGVLPQSFAPAARLTARELLRYYGGLYADARSAESVLAEVGLTESADTWYESLSGGQRRRLCVGTALVNDPDLLVVDEPTTGIDPVGRRAVWRVIERLADDGTAVLLTSHSMTEVERLADRVGLMRDGRLVAEGTPSALIDRHGGRERLTIGVAGDTSPAALAERLDAGDVWIEEESIVVPGVRPAEIGRVIEPLPAAWYDSVAWREPGLEDAYLSLTGEPFEAVDDGAVETARGIEASGTGPDTEPDADGTGRDRPTVTAEGTNAGEREESGREESEREADV